ncbi:MAG: tetratricopeptide repeat protein [Planctomycetota bacterium]
MQTLARSVRCALVLFMVCSLTVLAQEREERGPRPEERERERDRPRRPEEGWERGRFMPQPEWDHHRPPKPPQEQDPFADLGDLNVVDKAFYTVAQLLYEKGEYENAIKELSKVVDESPDERAKAGAHLVAGHIYRFKLQQTDQALAEYKQVTGDLADRAMKSMIQCYETMGQPDQAAKVLEDRLMQATQTQEKAFILNEVANIYRRAGNIDKAIETLRRIPQMITYDEAEAIRMDKGPGRPDFFPMDKVRERIEELRAKGQFEDAERMEQKVREMQEKMRGGRPDKPPEKPVEGAPRE